MMAQGALFAGIETPALILDQDRLAANARRMLSHCAAHGVVLRPHVKTSKSVEVAKIATGGRLSTITVSTLAEAEHFAREGFDDILYAVGITPNKFARVSAIGRQSGKTIVLSLDSVEMATAVAASGLDNPVVIEVDCGEHRGGLPADDEALPQIVRVLGGQCVGVMAHAGHSYATDDIGEVARVAAAEIAAAKIAAKRIGISGGGASIVSIGSTPTVLHASSLEGVTEVRAGIYLFGDLSQYGRNIVTLNDIALSVLATVIGHNRAGSVLTLDAGALALSKDVGANPHLMGAGYGWVCDAVTLKPLGLSVGAVHQEHGSVAVADPFQFDRLPIGSVVRILPNHACLTAAGGYGAYHLTDGRIWSRVDGW